MEWSWLRDWWRLKKYHCDQRRRKLKHLSRLNNGDCSGGNVINCNNNNNTDEENQSSSSHQHFYHHHSCVNNSCSDFDEDDIEKFISDDDELLHKRIRRHRRRLRLKRLTTIESVTNENNNDNDIDNSCKNNNSNNNQVGGGEVSDENNIDVVDYDYNDDNDADDDYNDDDDEVDDFCYCDECLNGDTDFCESNDGMDSDASTSSNPGKQVVVGICAMAKKTQSKPMKEILTRLQEFEFIKMLIFEEDVILKEPVENWPICDCLVSFHSKGFPLEKAIQYAQLRKPYVLNNLHMQYDIQDRRRVYAILQKEGIEIPRYAVLDRDSPDPKQHELIESEDHVEVNGIIFNKPFVEKPVSAEDHNIYIYYPTSAGGGSQRLFRKIGSRSSVYSPESRVRKTGSFIYEDFMPTDGTDVKVYTVGPDYAHAEARKSPALDGKVERDSEGKEIRYPVILNHAEKLISRKVCLAFKQTVCGFDLLRANGKSYVCDVNGFSFVKNSNKYYDDCAKILGNMILRELTPTLHIPWSVPFQLDDPPIVPTTFGKMMELRCVVAVIRHGDRTPKQKMKVEVRHPKFFEIFEKYDGFKHGHVKLKRPKQLQEILDIARFLLAEIETKDNAEIEEKKSKLEQLKSVLEMYGHFSGINRKVQMKYQPKGRPRGSSSDDDAPTEPSLVLILKWGGELTPAGRIQAEELGRIFRCMYPGGQGRQDYSGTQGLGLLRLHSTFRHDLKIYASDEGRVQMTAAAFAKGLLALEGELTPILVQMVKSANTNGLLDNDCDSSKYQNMAKTRLHELMRVDREFTAEDRMAINPNNSISINQALDFVKNPVECCNHVHSLIKELLIIISVKKDDPKTKDAILYHGETWDLMRCRWEKIEKDFSTKSKLYDISKIPDIYDCIKYDLQHNQHTLQYDQAEELYTYAKYLADIVIPQEYGLTMQEKLTIGQGICTPLLKKIKSDLQRNIEEVEDESVNRLNPQYSHGVASPGRHVRTRLYFTSESHVHSLLTVLRYGGLLNVLTDEQWRRAMDYISMVSELNYMSQIVIMLYEDPTKDPTSEERFHVELHFSPGVNCCVQKNLPPGPGFRPHSRNDSGQLRTSLQSYDDSNSNPSRIDEENDTEETPNKIHTLSPDGLDYEIRPVQKSKPIPIGAHHTVSGHEAMDLAKRLNQELASQQQQTKQTGSLETNRPISPDGEIRSRSFEQRSKNAKEKEDETTDINYKDKEFKEILTSRVTNLNRSVFQIRVTDSLTLFKIDSSTNELPLSEIDFSINPGTPEGQGICTAHQKSTSPGERLQKRQAQLLTMRRMESGDEPDFVQKLRDCRKISPLATNERPLSCNCSYHLSSVNEDEVAYPHSHSKSEADISDILPYAPGKISSPPITTVELSQRNSFEEEYQLSSSAPASLMSGEFLMNFNKGNNSLKPSSASNSPTASTLQLCHALEETPRSSAPTSTPLIHSSNNKHVSCNSSRSSRQTKPIKQCLPSAQSAPVIVDMVNPFKFPALYSFKQFASIAENAATNTTFLPPDSISPYTLPTTMASPSSSSQLKLHTCTNSPIVSGTKPTTHYFNAYHHPYHNPNPYPLHHFYMHGDQSYHHSLPRHLRHHQNNNYNLHTHTSPTNTHIPNVIVTYDETSATSLKNLTSNTAVVSPSFSPSPADTITLRSYNKFSIDTITTTATTNTVDKPVNTLSSSIIKPIADNTTTDSTVTSTSSSSSVSSRRQRHSIAGQMSYMKMLGFGGFSKKMTTSSNSLFSTAVISGSSSAPNLRDMIPVSSSVLDGFGGVPPIRPLETLHNALSLKQLDQFLEKMISAPLFKTPTSTPPKNPSTPLSMMTTKATLEEDPSCTAITPTNHVCHFSDISLLNDKKEHTIGDRCSKCGQLLTFISSTTIVAVTQNDTNAMSITPIANDERATAGGEGAPPLWSKQSSIASSITEPSSPAMSDTCSQETPSCDMSISLTSTDGYNMPSTAAQRLAKFFPRLDDDLNSVSVYAPVNLESLEGTEAEINNTGAIGGLAEGGGYDAKSACLTPVSFNMDLSIVANKGSLTLSVDGFEDDDDATPSAATTPSLPQDEPQLEFCYCCEAHSSQGQPPDDTQKSNELFNILRNKRLVANEPKQQQCYCRDNATLSGNLLNTELTTTPAVNIRKASDTISPRIQKQISLFESGELERQKEISALHASINIPQPNSLQLKQDARLRKFENLTQSTSNSNFPFESNTLKRVPNNVEDFIDANITQSCINLKSSDGVAASNTSSACSSPQHKVMSVFRPVTQSCSTMQPEEGDTATSGPASPRPGALIVKEKFIEPPKRITRSFHGKTQSMDSDMLFNEFLLVPSHSMATQNSSSSDTGSAATSPSSRSNKRFITTKVLDEDLENVYEH